MKQILFIAALGTIALTGCTKKADQTSAQQVTSSAVVSDFVSKIALPQYAVFLSDATALNNSLVALDANPTNENLTAARTNWKNTRAAWEKCEAFLFGPVADNNYDPDMDTWPVDHLQLDSFIANSTSFDAGTIHGLGQSLRGFHPIEFILWGRDGQATVDSITTAQKKYMIGLSRDLLNSVDSLHTSWAVNGGNFQSQLLMAGKGSTRYLSRQEAILTIVAGISDICDEVGNGKLYEPFNTYDSTKTESPFSHNSITDFTNNITGAQSVYLCSLNGQSGNSLSQLVATRNLSLDNKIKQQFATAIGALNNVNVNFELAIFTQRTQLQTAMTALNNLKATLDGELKTFVQTYVTD